MTPLKKGRKAAVSSFFHARCTEPRYPLFLTMVALGNVRVSLAIRTSESACYAPKASDTTLEAISLPLL